MSLLPSQSISRRTDSVQRRTSQAEKDKMLTTANFRQELEWQRVKPLKEPIMLETK
jgi:hypothetical protein